MMEAYFLASIGGFIDAFGILTGKIEFEVAYARGQRMGADDK